MFDALRLCRQVENQQAVQSCVFGTSGRGLIDFEEAIDAVRPDIFCVTTNGDGPEKRAICTAKGVRSVVASRCVHGRH